MRFQGRLVSVREGRPPDGLRPGRASQPPSLPIRSRREQSVMEDAAQAPVAPIDRARSMLERALPAEGGGTLQERRDGYEAVLSQLPIPDGTSVTATSYAGVNGFWVRAPEAVDDRIGVLLHGGGYIIGSAKGYRAYAADVSRATGARI